MTSTGINGLNLFSQAAVSTGQASQSTGKVGNFDDTLRSMKNDGVSEKTETGRVEKSGQDNPKVDQMTSANTKNPVKKEDELTDEQIAAISDEIIGQIKQVIMTELNVSEEQLNNAMEVLGMTEENLLNPMELPLLLMKLEGVENQGDMLTNQDFAKDLRSIMQALEDIKENVNTQVEELDTKLYEENVETVDESLVDAKDDQSVKAENDISDDDTSELPKMEEANQSDAQMTGNESNADDNDGLLQRKEVADTEIHDDLNLDKQLLSPQDFAAKLTEDLTQKVGETKANDIVRQVIEQAQVQVKQNVTSMEMQLYPEHLGKVLIQVSTHDGHVTAQITAESEAAKTAMETQLTLLKDNLNNQGLKIEHIEVTIASHAFEQNMQGERGNDEQAAQSRKSRRNIGNIYGEADDEMLAEEQQKIMEITGSTVSYSA